MNAFEKGALRDLLLLSLTAGSADAAGYMGLGRVFTSNMTGNVVLFGIALGEGQPLEALRSLLVLLIFLAGACLGAWLGRDVAHRGWSFLASRIIGAEAALLLLFALFWFLRPAVSDMSWTWTLITLLAVAMGMQSSALYLLSVPGVVTTAITGTFVSLVGGLVGKMSAAEAPAVTKASRSRIGFQALVVGLYAAGAVLSGLLTLYAPRWMGVPAAALVLFVAAARVREAHFRTRGHR